MIRIAVKQGTWTYTGVNYNGSSKDFELLIMSAIHKREPVWFESVVINTLPIGF